MKRVLIVKLGAMGDVLRTTPLLSIISKLYPECRVDWVVDDVSAVVLKNNPLIQQLMIFSPETLGRLSQTHYDLALNLDKEPEALDTLAASGADVKRGFGWNASRNAMVAVNPASDYALRLGLDDELKFRRNVKTYQEISCEQAELPYSKEEYVFTLPDAAVASARKQLTDQGVPESDLGKCIGINTGSGHRFAGKRLPEEHIVALAKYMHQGLKCPILLLGGPEEEERNQSLSRRLKGIAIHTGTDHSIQIFAGLVSQCRLVLTGDTIAMHIAIAMRVPALVYFGSTCASEIELYGRGKKNCINHFLRALL